MPVLRLCRMTCVALLIAVAACSQKEEAIDAQNASAFSESRRPMTAEGDVAVRSDAGTSPAVFSPNDFNSSLKGEIGGAIRAAGLSMRGDPEAVRRFVGNQIAFETYEGVLKGAGGAFLTRTANSADQALLMAEMIGSHDPRPAIRFASCYRRETSVPGALAKETVAWNQGDLEALAGGVRDPDLKTRIRSFALAMRRAQLEAKDAAAALVPVVDSMVSSIIDKRGENSRAETTHVWLQVEQQGRWSDLDPSTATGAAPCSPTSVVSALPAAFFHRITVRLVVESRKDGRIQETEVLQLHDSTAALAASRVLFAFGEPFGLVQRQPASAAGLDRYTPVFRIDGETVSGAAIELPRISDVGSVQGLPDAAGGVFGGDFFGGGEETAPLPEDAVTAAWLEIDVLEPGRLRTRVRSTVFDRLGAAARQDGSAPHVVVQPLEEIMHEYAAMSSVWQIGIVPGGTAAPEAARTYIYDPTTVDGLSAVLDGLVRVISQLRLALNGTSATPLVILAGAIPATGANGEPSARLVLDAVHVAVQFPANTSASVRDAISTPLAEDLLASQLGGDSQSVESMAGVMRAARKSAEPFVTVKPGESRHVRAASSEALARIRSRSEQGFALVLPASAVGAAGDAQLAWWYVDPVTGVIGDEHENGRHPAVVERSVPESKNPSSMEQLRRFGCSIARPVVIAATAVFLLTKFTYGGDLLGAIADTQTEYIRNVERGEEALKVACGSGNVPTGGAPPPPIP